MSYFLSRHRLASFLCKFRRVEEFTPLRGSSDVINGDYSFFIRLKREELSAIPDIISFSDQQMSVVAEGRQPLCWYCKQLGICSQNVGNSLANGPSNAPSDHPPDALEKAVKTETSATSAETINKRGGLRQPEKAKNSRPWYIYI